MILEIEPRKISGSVVVPSCKSFALRAILAASFCDGVSLIENVEFCEDVKSMVFGLEKLGVRFEFKGKILKVFGRFKKDLNSKRNVIDCLNCGFSFRVFSFLLAALFPNFFLKGTKELFKRPLVCDIFLEGKKFEYLERFGDFFVVKRKLVSGKYEVDCSVSSQFLTGLLFTLPLLDGNSEIILKSKIESLQYVEMTWQVLKKFGVFVKKTRKGFFIRGNQNFKETKFLVEGDYSNSAFFSLFGAFWPVELKGLKKSSVQKDRIFFKVIRKAGCYVKFKHDSFFISPKRKLKPFVFDISKNIDLAVCFAIFACFCDGISTLFGIERLRFKESDRVVSILNLINSLGGKAKCFKDRITIEGGKKLKGGFVKGFKDHRVVMAAFSISCFCENSTFVSDVESVFKSNINFFKDFRSLGGVFRGVHL